MLCWIKAEEIGFQSFLVGDNEAGKLRPVFIQDFLVEGDLIIQAGAITK